MSDTPILYVLRGVPGSGKSSYCRDILPTAVVCSADNYFIRPDGFYDWNKNLLSRAHEWCYETAEGAMQEQNRFIALDNTNIKKAHYSKYLALATKWGYSVREIVVGSLDEDHCRIYAKRNVHSVSLNTILRMAKEFEV